MGNHCLFINLQEFSSVPTASDSIAYLLASIGTISVQARYMNTSVLTVLAILSGAGCLVWCEL